MRLERQLVALLRLLADREQAHLGLGDLEHLLRRRSSPCGRTGAGAPAARRRSRPQSISTDGPVARPGSRPRSPAGRPPAAAGARGSTAASIAPVFPAETTASASPSPTARQAATSELSGFERTASAGFSSIAITSRRLDELQAAACRGPAARRGSARSPSAAASSAPATISSGARSPPIASTATRTVTCPTGPACGAARSRARCTSCSSGTCGAAASAGPHCGHALTRGASSRCVARRLSRRDLEVFFFGTAIGRRV